MSINLYCTLNSLVGRSYYYLVNEDTDIQINCLPQVVHQIRGKSRTGLRQFLILGHAAAFILKYFVSMY